jgi:2-keto-4-pentenoate hydratase/2-oxohepta-3-ene-1,7-dioic acid hydratase in catechol pathway
VRLFTFLDEAGAPFTGRRDGDDVVLPVDWVDNLSDAADDSLEDWLAVLARQDGEAERHPIAGLRPAPAVSRPGKVVCVGLNYADHATETGVALPTEPVLFLKTTDTVIGPNDDVLIPRGSERTDYEVELAVAIGKTARYLGSPAESRGVIAGYVISNDVSEREFQLDRGGQWDKGKSCETFNPFGPWLVTADEVPDPQALGLRLWVNDELRQDGSTANMAFGVDHLIWYISQFLVLRPGDIVNTGTPAGVALGRPGGGGYLRAGDVVRLEIDGLGAQRQRLVPA